MYVVVFILEIFMFSSAYENLALMKPTWQSSTYDATYTGSDKAVDGLKSNLSFLGHQCSNSANDKQKNATWMVNLTDVYSINNIVIYYRTENRAWETSKYFPIRFMGFYVYISNTTDRASGKLCFHDTNYTRTTIPPVVNISCPVHGQYVIYYNERPVKSNLTNEYSTYAFIELCEVEVFGCSGPRKYGYNCSQKCPKNCEEYCHIKSGNCLRCLPGYRGDRCEECKTGFYGENCTLPCGNCKDSFTCNRVNGTCSKGCIAGYEGLLCIKECKTGFYGENCSLTCGHCKDSHTCNRVNGACLNGCAAGYQGLLCNKECETGRYGTNCNMVCGSCSSSGTCNPINGTCPKGCQAGFGGALCKRENLAYGKPTYQSTTHDPAYSASSNAVDGKRTDLSYLGKQCSVSRDGERTATWWVNLEGIRGIKSIDIYYRTGNTVWGSGNGFTGRFLGFYVFVSNTTNRLKGTLCFHDTTYTNATIPAVANISCPVHGQYVIYYNERLQGKTYPTGYSPNAFTELCEVEVFGCSDPTRYGPDCMKSCSTNCLQYCHVETGECPQCAPGYTGKWCEKECDDGLYGDNCSMICGNCFDSESCNSVNGTCMDGCVEGYEGSFCNKECKNGTFGRNCQENCNSTCTNCNSTNGKCDSGCHPGWKGDYCHEECTDGKFGVRCEEDCGHCLNTDQCHHINGTCPSGCEKGYKSPLCNTTCDNRTYGQDCDNTCGACFNLEQCHPINGTCMNGCHAGHEGILCNETCQNGTFGRNCQEKCNSTCYGCNSVNGKCETGCHSGWKGDYCHEVCEKGKFGRNCNKTCNSTCYGCNRTNGKCETGCHAGWKGDYCHETCDGGQYGFNCNMQCGNCFDTEQCNPINGTCINGCEEGFEGFLCNETCKYGKFGRNCLETCNRTCFGCNETSGKCETGCYPGWKGDYCHEKCDGGSYGINCSMLCGNCLNAEQCNAINGTCMDGCDAGYEGNLCNKSCENWTFGPNCLETCNSTCYGCNTTNGICETGCFPGWKGEYCHQECDGGFYGVDCSMLCGKCFDMEQCHPVNGTCVNGCNEGFTETYCNETCENGTFGHNCLEKCNNTCYGCNGTNGKCDTGCFPGWKGDYCHQECDGGYYGPDCNMKCGHCLDMEQCNPINGTCINGCNDGFQGFLCKTSCIIGTFGRNCLETCNSTCYGCNTTNGKCETGCHPGWKGDYCHRACDGGHFGEDCRIQCGHCLNDAQCHHINGSCMNGCAAGYNGTQCIEVCSKGFYGLKCVQECHTCKESTCLPHNGTCVLGLVQTLEEEDSSQIVGGAVGAVVFVLIVPMAVILFIFVRRRYRKPDTQRKNSRLLPENTGEYPINNVYTNSNAVHELRKKGGQTYNSADELKMEQLIPNGEEKDIREDMDDLYMNQPSFSEIPIDQLGAVIAEKSENENEGFRKEYTAFPSGAIHKCDEGKRTENVPKNRFKTTFPYDHSRVILRRQDENSSDYINANYIDGPNRKKEYIAAQGPKQNTLGDFWAMLWQENISTVVMLTNLREGEKIKCTQYWPDKDKHINYGEVSVKWMEEREYAFFVTRKLKVINKEMKKSRVLTHYHYTAWPDHGTPDPMCLIIFHNHVIRTQSNQKTAPTVVHCSAGVGRTGTYIALDILHQMGNKTGKVNVAECVRKMRENRMTMVQTNEQYIAIFLTLQEDFKAPLKVDSIEDIKEKLENSGKDTPINQNVLHTEFQLLHKICPIYTEADFKFSKQSSGHKDNDEILPLDKFNVHLSSYVPKRGSYINAISVPSFTKPTGFIVTPYPPTEDAVDFLRLLNDHECDTVICMDPLAEIQSTNEWFPPTSSSKFVPPFMVYCQSHSQTDVTSSTIQIVHDKKEDEAHIVRIVEPTARIKVSGDSMDTSQLRNLVSAALSTDTENPIVVMSKDGASLCGIFCAVHNVLEQINIDECADIFTAVRQILIRRPEFCTKIEEYRLIYKAVNDHLQSSSENIYFNQ